MQLERALRDAEARGAEPHPFASHLLVHLKEVLPYPRSAAAAPAARLLAGWPAGSSHLVHMAGHLFMRTGDYHGVVDSNLAAVRADRRQEAACLSPYVASVHARVPNSPLTLRNPRRYVPGHNEGMLALGAMYSGQFDLALREAGAFPLHGEPRAAMAPGAWAQDLHFVHPPPRAVVLARAGRWGDLEREPLDLPAGSPAFNRVVALYAAGLLAAARRDPDRAAARLGELRLVAAEVPEAALPAGHHFHPRHREVTALFADVLAARVALLDGDFPAAVAELEEAVAKYDALPYMEPEHFYLPVRTCLGAVLLARGDRDAARARYEEDLAEHPENGWSLRGLLRLAHAEAGTGGGTVAARAADLEGRFRRAWAKADSPIKGSCCEFGLC